jgi:hypothetical protein
LAFSSPRLYYLDVSARVGANQVALKARFDFFPARRLHRAATRLFESLGNSLEIAKLHFSKKLCQNTAVPWMYKKRILFFKKHTVAFVLTRINKHPAFLDVRNISARYCWKLGVSFKYAYSFADTEFKG